MYHNLIVMPSNKHQSAIESNTSFMVKMEDLVRELVVQNDIPCYRIESKMDQRTNDAGDNIYVPVVRVITYFEDAVNKISDIMATEFEIDSAKTKNTKKAGVDSFSYKHIQIEAGLKQPRLELVEYRRSGDKKFEIQVCSMLQDAWSGIEKELGYHNAAIPEDMKRDFYRVGALLEMADLEFLKIRTQLAAAKMVLAENPDLKAEIEKAEAAKAEEKAAAVVAEAAKDAAQPAEKTKTEKQGKNKKNDKQAQPVQNGYPMPGQPYYPGQIPGMPMNGFPGFMPQYPMMPNFYQHFDPNLGYMQQPMMPGYMQQPYMPGNDPYAAYMAQQQGMMQQAEDNEEETDETEETTLETAQVVEATAAPAPEAIPTQVVEVAPAPIVEAAPAPVAEVVPAAPAPVVEVVPAAPAPVAVVVETPKIEVAPVVAAVAAPIVAAVVAEAVSAKAEPAQPYTNGTPSPLVEAIKETASNAANHVTSVDTIEMNVSRPDALDLNIKNVGEANGVDVAKIPEVLQNTFDQIAAPINPQAVQTPMIQQVTPAPQAPQAAPAQPRPQATEAKADNNVTSIPTSLEGGTTTVKGENGENVALNIDWVDTFNMNVNGFVEHRTEIIDREAMEKAIPFYERDEKPARPQPLDENAPMTDSMLKEYITGSKQVREIDAEIARRAGATLNNEVDVEGDVERLKFLKVYTLKQLHERLLDNKNDLIAFAEKWIGADNGGSFDSGICLFYLEYLLVGKRNDPAFAVEYVLKFISDNDYSARFIIPTYNSISKQDKPIGAHLTLKH